MFPSKGKLYNDEEQLMANVNYRLMPGTLTELWGELVPVEDQFICNGSDYIIELENNDKIKCRLQANFHRPFSIPARYTYRFEGIYPIYTN